MFQYWFPKGSSPPFGYSVGVTHNTACRYPTGSAVKVIPIARESVDVLGRYSFHSDFKVSILFQTTPTKRTEPIFAT